MIDHSRVGYLSDDGTSLLVIGFDGPYVKGSPIYNSEFTVILFRSLVSALKPQLKFTGGHTPMFTWPDREGTFEFRLNREAGTVRCHIRAPRFMTRIKAIVDPLLAVAGLRQDNMFPTDWNVAPDVDMVLDESFWRFLRSAEELGYFFFAAGRWIHNDWRVLGASPAFMVHRWTVLDPLTPTGAAT